MRSILREMLTNTYEVENGIRRNRAWNDSGSKLLEFSKIDSLKNATIYGTYRGTEYSFHRGQFSAV